MKNKQTIKAVFFDLDGTLLYTLPDIAAVVNHALRKYGYPALPVEEYRYLVGWGLEYTVTKALGNGGADPKLREKIISAMKKEYFRHPVRRSEVYDGVKEMLGELRRQGILMAILSNKEDSITQKVVQRCFGEFDFIAVQGSSAEVPPKPDPTGLQNLLYAAGMDLREVIFVGDTTVDMETARRLGVKAIGVSWGYRSAAELEEAGADRIINSPSEIIELVPVVSLD